jgi:hypothetical protein
MHRSEFLKLLQERLPQLRMSANRNEGLLHINSTIPIGIYITICAVISIASALLLRDYTNKDIALEHQYGSV